MTGSAATVEPDASVEAINVQERALHEAVGRAVSRWSNVETSLLHAFATATGMPIRSCAALFAQVKTFALARDLVDAAVREAIERSRATYKGKGAGPGKIGLAYWVSLVEYVRELSSDRNYLAHNPVVVHLGTPFAGGVACLVGPPTIAHYAGLGVDPRQPPLDLNEVEELGLDFHHAHQLIEDFHGALRLHGPLPQKYFEPVVRRRPRRSQRLEAAGRPPKSRP